MVNLFGARTRLRDNSKSAMLAAIEIYNKPQFKYRDECFVILLINAWELILKALLSKNRRRIYYPKQRNEDYRTFSITHSLQKAERFFPPELEFTGVKKNLELLLQYRDNSIHFYNTVGFGSLIYFLVQASIKNYSDLLSYSFNVDLTDEINIVLLPLGIGKMPIDPIQFIQDVDSNVNKYSEQVSKYIRSVNVARTELEEKDIDITRLMVTLSIRFESVKKSTESDIVVGVDNSKNNVVAIKRFDPNSMLRRKDILEKLPAEIDGVQVNSYTFQAYVWKNKIREKEHLYWKDKSSGLTKYSPELIAMIKGSSGKELKQTRQDYSNHLATKRQKK